MRDINLNSAIIMLFFSFTKQAELFYKMTMDEILPTIEINPAKPAQRSVIWLHGLGADGSDFVPIVSELQSTQHLNIRFIFPHAPIMPVSINNGYEMRAWFDIYDIAIAAKIDESGISNSIKQLEKLIDKEVERGIPTENIIVAGFSQGAVIALNTGLCYSKKLAGILALSGYLPMADKVLQNASKINRDTPIFLAHGSEDPIVPYALGKATYASLQQAGYPVTWHSYPMPHSVCPEEIDDIAKWINDVF